MLPLPFLLPPKEFNNNKFLELLPRSFALSARVPSVLVAGVWGSTVAHATVAAALALVLLLLPFLVTRSCHRERGDREWQFAD